MESSSPLRSVLTKSIDKRLGDVHTVLNGLVMAKGRALTAEEMASVEAAEEIINDVRNDIWKLAGQDTQN
jgi:hypothetical protein